MMHQDIDDFIYHLRTITGFQEIEMQQLVAYQPNITGLYHGQTAVSIEMSIMLPRHPSRERHDYHRMMREILNVIYIGCGHIKDQQIYEDGIARNFIVNLAIYTISTREFFEKIKTYARTIDERNFYNAVEEALADKV